VRSTDIAVVSKAWMDRHYNALRNGYGVSPANAI
jgi:hypothetical protein